MSVASSSVTEVRSKRGLVRCPLVSFSLPHLITAAALSPFLMLANRGHSRVKAGTEGHLALPEDRTRSWPHPGVEAPPHLNCHCPAKWSHSMKDGGLPSQGNVIPDACDKGYSHLHGRENPLMLLPVRQPSPGEPLLGHIVQAGPTLPPESKSPLAQPIRTKPRPFPGITANKLYCFPQAAQEAERKLGPAGG